MNKEIQDKISWQDIKQAEEKRFLGNRQEAINKVKSASIDNKELKNLSKEDLTTHLAAWRIDVDAHTALARRNPSGRKAIEILSKAKKVIDKYYHHPEVKKRIGEIKEDQDGNPYQFAAEILRDEGRYSSLLFEITGNPNFLLDAINSFDKAIEVAEEITISGLAKMESGILKDNYKQIKEGYNEVYLESLKRRNIDRARWSSKKWFIEAAKRAQLKDMQKAWKDQIQANKGIKETLKYLFKNEIPKAAVGAFLHLTRRLTVPDEIDQEQLRVQS